MSSAADGMVGGDRGELRAVGDCTSGVNAVGCRCEAATDSVLPITELTDGSGSGSGAGYTQTKAACAGTGDKRTGSCHEGCCGEECRLHDGSMSRQLERMGLRMMVEVEVENVFQIGCLLRTRGVPAFIDQKYLSNLLIGIPNSPNR